MSWAHLVVVVVATRDCLDDKRRPTGYWYGLKEKLNEAEKSDITFTLTNNEPSDGYKEFRYSEKPFTSWIEDDFPNKPDGGRRGVNKVLGLYADAQKALFKKRPFADDTEPICCDGVVGLLGFLFLLLVDIAYVIYACLCKGLDRGRDVHLLWLSVIFWFVVLVAFLTLKTHAGYVTFDFLGKRMAEFLENSLAGSRFVFGASDCFAFSTEAPLITRSYSAMSTNSELHAMIFNGFTSIAGPVLAAFISSGVPPNHLLIACIISAPAALAVSKIIYPETKISPVASSEFSLKLKSPYNSVLEAAMVNAMEAVPICAGITANLIAFLKQSGLTWLTKEVHFSTKLKHIIVVIALTVIVNTEKAKVLGTYALCGFANIGSIGILLGVLVTILPQRRADLTSMLVGGMIGGNIAGEI
ncbi:Solute carrier family 28 member 3 [Echinococcus granulosus]|uniref:Solute carrier family 28 member 3 n=1 Tax=Echinococcus granulosus TaxID=6210 RepID=W6V499_ECHGR|nr:Solute carrier family 28 member 3 [Echinococcus granulosus]EUB60934.1 Solute carrier family 28 member 3 [Echinococcus granulosus]